MIHRSIVEIPSRLNQDSSIAKPEWLVQRVKSEQSTSCQTTHHLCLSHAHSPCALQQLQRQQLNGKLLLKQLPQGDSMLPEAQG